MASLLIAPLEALVDPRLTDPERRVLLALYSFRNKNADTVWPSVDSIGERAGIKDRTRVSKITKSLADKGWLSKKKRGFTGGNEYALFVPEFAENALSNLDSETTLEQEATLDGKSKMDGDTSSNVVPETTSNLDSETTYKEQQIEQQNEQQSETMLFDQFWSAYPRKAGKQNAIKAWGKISPDQPLLKTILENIQARLDSGEWDKGKPQFIPHPATYLNGGRWEDEIIAGNDSYEADGRLIQ